MSEEVADLEPAAEEIPAVRPTKPHDNRICQNYVTYLACTEQDKLTRQRCTNLIYEDIRDLSLILMMKKYGYSPRIDTEAIAHEVATSAVMTVVVRHKNVDSWTNLIRKITHDLSNKWMKSNLYSHHSKMLSLDEFNLGDDDNDPFPPTLDVPVYDMDPNMIYMYYAFLGKTMDSITRILDNIGSDFRSRMLAKTALSHAMGTLPSTALAVLPPHYRHKVQFYSYQVKQRLRPALSSKHFERAFFG